MEGGGILTHVMHELYNLPCASYLDMRSPYNLKREAEAHFNESFEKLSANLDATLKCLNYFVGDYRTSHLMLTAGADYAFVHAEIQFTFLDRVIKLLNKRVYRDPSTGKTRKFLVQYSTLNDYFQAIQNEASQTGIKWPVYRGDIDVPLDASAPLS